MKTQVRVRFNANGGYWDEETPGDEIRDAYINMNSYADYPMPYHDNQFAYFLGWFDQPEGGRNYENIRIKDEIELYAHWLIREPEEAALDTGIKASSEEGESLYAFTPEETATYKIYTYDRSRVHLGLRLTLYDSDMEYITSDYNGRGYTNAMIIEELEAGKTYYVGATGSDYFDEAFASYSYGIVFRKAESCTVTLHLNQDIDNAYYGNAEARNSEYKFNVVKNTVLNKNDIPKPDYTDESLYLEGWARNENGTGSINRLFITDDTDIYAVWGEASTVTYVLNTDKEKANWYGWDDEVLNPETDTWTEPVTRKVRKGTSISSYVMSHVQYDDSIHLLG